MVSVGELTLPNSIFLSSTVNVAVLTVVVVPSTCKLPFITTVPEALPMLTALVAPVAKLTVVAFAVTKLNVVAVVVISPPVTARSDVISTFPLVPVISVSYTHLRAHET